MAIGFEAILLPHGDALHTQTYVHLGGSVTETITGAKTFAARILVPDGTAAAPSIAFASEPTSGLYHGALGGQIGLTISGIPRLFVSGTDVRLGSGSFLGFTDGLADGGILDTILVRDAPNTLALRNGANPQRLNLYGTFTDPANYARLATYASGGHYVVLTEAAGTGTHGNLTVGSGGAFSLFLQTNATNRWEVQSDGTLRAVADNTYALGQTGGNRPSVVYSPRHETGAGVTLTASAPCLNLAQAWNAGAVTFTGMLVNVTDTASAAASLLADWQVGGASKVKIGKGGDATFAGILTAPRMGVPGTLGLFGANNTATPNSKYDVVVERATLLYPTDGSLVSYQTPGLLTVDTAVQGANGRDQSSAFSASSWLHLYAIGATALAAPALLLSLAQPWDPFSGNTPTALTAAVGAAGNVEAGFHSYIVTFAGRGGESVPGTASGTVNPGVASQINLTAIPTGPIGTIARYIYRSTAGDVLPRRFLTAIYDNATTTYTDNSADGSLAFSAPGASITMPATYTHRAYLGAMFFNASSQLVRVRLRGQCVMYDIAQAVLTDGAATSQTPINIYIYVPVNALAFSLSGSYLMGGSGGVLNVPSLGILGGQVYWKPQFTATGVQGTAQFPSEVPNIGQFLTYLWNTNVPGAGARLSLEVTSYRMAGGGD